MNRNESKPCPHCYKTISANKEMCMAGVTQYGSLKEFLAAKLAERNQPDKPDEPSPIDPEGTRDCIAAPSTI